MPRNRIRSRLYRRPNSPFIWAEYTLPDGTDVRQSTGCRDDAAARAWLATRELERVRGEAGIPVARSVSILQATAEYLVQRKPEWSDGWYTTVEGFVRTQVLPHFTSARAACTISRADVEAFRAQQIGRPRHGRAGTVSDATVNRLMAALAAFGEWCLVSGRSYHTTNPWAKHEPLAEDQDVVPEVEAAQLEKILAALEDPDGELPSHGRRYNRAPWRSIVEFALETGLRKGELSKARRDDARLADRVLFITSTRKKGRTKSRKLRAVFLSRRAMEIIEAAPARTDGLLFGPVPDPRRAFARASKAAGLERVWMHLFRHLAASRLGERGAAGHELQAFGGWSSLRMVQRYTHARQQRMLELLDGPATPGAGAPKEE